MIIVLLALALLNNLWEGAMVHEIYVDGISDTPQLFCPCPCARRVLHFEHLLSNKCFSHRCFMNVGLEVVLYKYETLFFRKKPPERFSLIVEGTRKSIEPSLRYLGIIGPSHTSWHRWSLVKDVSKITCVWSQEKVQEPYVVYKSVRNKLSQNLKK